MTERTRQTHDPDVGRRNTAQIGRRIRARLPEEAKRAICRELRELKEESSKSVKVLINRDNLLKADSELSKLRLIKDLRATICRGL